MATPKSLTISIRRWQHGNRRAHDWAGSYSELLNPETNKMCCLGFLGKACGLTEDDMRDFGTPACVNPKAKKLWPEGVRPKKQSTVNTPWAQKAMNLNDEKADPDTLRRFTLESRKKRLRAHFKEISIKLRFVP